ncbi:MAG TPA: outer membrane beta-barrel protein [Hyphomicrobiaceae bacterium]|nr:outer membrane beta-barrel protein [Hyphomicrobiaceae bacterium]
MRSLLRASAALLLLIAGSAPSLAQNYDGGAVLKFGVFGQTGPFKFSEPAVGSSSRSDIMGGVSAGMDIQLPYNWMIGAEIDGSFGDSRGFVGPTDYGFDYMLNARGRVGYFAHPDLLVYATAGISWLGFEAQQGPAIKTSETVGGWNVGVGVEYQWHHVILFGEYFHAGFASHDFTLNGGAHTVDIDADVFRLGLKFKVGHDHTHPNWGRHYEPEPLK